MTTGIVDDLEVIEIQVAQGIFHIPLHCIFEGLADTPLELAPVDQAGKQVMRGLVGHLGQAAQLGNIVENEYHADDLVTGVPDRGGEHLD